MKYLSYRANNAKRYDQMFIEEVAVADIAHAVGTPFYCYSAKNLRENFLEFKNKIEAKNSDHNSDHNSGQNFKDYKICYAIKANFNLHLVKILAELGAGIDAVSAGEIFVALQAGVNPKKIVFAGVGKTREEIQFALQNGVEEFSVESKAEMFLLNEIAMGSNVKAKFSLRVNPNVDAQTHHKISTGKKGDKFGVDIEQALDLYLTASKLPGLEIHGIAMHIGSQITAIEPFADAFKKMRELFFNLQKLKIKIHSLDFGGGIGILYKNEKTILLDDYVKLLKEICGDLDVKIVIAPGRAIVGSAGLLVVKTLFLKPTALKNFIVIDGAINDLMRPGLYGSYHEVLPVFKRLGDKKIFDFAGPVCESTDILAQQRFLVEPKVDDLFVFCSAGAYGSSMSSEYNFRKLVPEILVDGKEFRVIRRRPSYEDMLKLYQIN
jgi:diaminopimelate decarboxylase